MSQPHEPLAHANLQDAPARSWGCLCQQQGHITRNRAGFIFLQEAVEEMGAGRVANADVSRAATPGGQDGPIQTIPSLTLPGAVKCPDPPDVPWEGYLRQAKGIGVVQPQYHRAPEHWECMSVAHSLTATCTNGAVRWSIHIPSAVGGCEDGRVCGTGLWQSRSSRGCMEVQGSPGAGACPRHRQPEGPSS